MLLDMTPDWATADRIQAALEQNGDRVADLHLWRVRPGHMAATVSIVSDHPQEPAHYKEKLAPFSKLSHVTVEVHPCRHQKQAP